MPLIKTKSLLSSTKNSTQAFTFIWTASRNLEKKHFVTSLVANVKGIFEIYCLQVKILMRRRNLHKTIKYGDESSMLNLFSTRTMVIYTICHVYNLYAITGHNNFEKVTYN